MTHLMCIALAPRRRLCRSRHSRSSRASAPSVAQPCLLLPPLHGLHSHAHSMDSRRARRESGVRRGVRRVRASGETDEHVDSRQRRLARQSRCRRASPCRPSAEVREVLTTARQISEWTGGKFDVTFGALVRSLEIRSRSGQRHSRHARGARPPAARSTIARFRSTTRRARCSSRAKGMSMHLGGIGKGYAVDRARRHPSPSWPS